MGSVERGEVGGVLLSWTLGWGETAFGAPFECVFDIVCQLREGLSMHLDCKLSDLGAIMGKTSRKPKSWLKS